MDSVKLIQDFLTFNGRLEKQPFIKRYIVVFLLMYGFFYLGISVVFSVCRCYRRYLPCLSFRRCRWR